MALWALSLVTGVIFLPMGVHADASEHDHAVEISHGEASHDEAVHGHVHGHDAEIEVFDWDSDDVPPLGFMFINFAILCVLVYMILRKPIGNRVKNRKADFESALKEANALKADAEKAMAEVKSKSELLDQEMAEIRKDVLENGKREAARITAEAEQRAARMKADTEILVKQELARMADEIRAEVIDQITLVARQALVKRITTADQDKLAGEYIKSMNEGSSQSSRQ